MFLFYLNFTKFVNFAKNCYNISNKWGDNMKLKNKMKNSFLFAFAFLVLFLGFGQERISAVEIAATNPKISLSYGSTSMLKGNTYTLKATIKPSNYEDKRVSWSSSNESVATVENGVVKAHSVGTATITARLEATGATAKKTINVKPVYASKVTINTSAFEMSNGEQKQLTATVSPSNVEKNGVSWKSSKTSVVSVDQNGLVTAHKNGTAYITATSNDGKRKATVLVKVTVPSPSNLIISSTTDTINKNQQLKLNVSVEPKGSDAGKFIWSSSNSSVASVNSSGYITGRKAGTVTITVKAKNGGASASIYITVEDKKLNKLYFNDKELEVEVNENQKLSLEIEPATASTNLKWSSSKSTVVSVDNNGNIKPKKEGTATITVKDNDTKKTAKIKITVTDPKKHLKLDIQSLALDINGGEFIHVYTDDEVTWKSKNSSIASVNQYGRVIGKKRGKTTITAKTSDGKTASVSVEVRSRKASNPEETPVYLEFNIDDEWDLMIPGMYIDFDEVDLISSNEDVFTVDGDGLVTATGAGKAYLTISPYRGEDRYVYVNVKEIAVKKVKVSDSKLTLTVGEEYEVDGWVEPDDASNKNLIWGSKKDSIASVDEGVICANKKGSTTIYVYSHDRKKSAKISVKVIED